jgi:hypothetical protein
MPDFSQKHYNQIAELLKNIDSEWFTEHARADVVDALVLLFERDNPKFRGTLFRAACSK